MSVRSRSLALVATASAIVAAGTWLAGGAAAKLPARSQVSLGRETVAAPQRPDSDDAGAKAQLRNLAGLPLYFIENRGQFDPRVAYFVQGRDTTLFFTADGVTLVQSDIGRRKRIARGGLEKASVPRAARDNGADTGRWVVKLDFVGATPHPRISARDVQPAVVSYFRGRRSNWKTGLSTSSSIVYSDLWPGVDLVYSGTASRLKYTFLVQPGADAASIRLAYRGVRGFRLNAAGQLEIETPAGALCDDRPYAYQDVDGRRVGIDVAYSLDPASTEGRHGYGFALGSYDRSRALVLDPAVLVYAGYVGGSGEDFSWDLAVDGAGNAYITGDTNSSQTSFPVTVGPDLTLGGSDAFVVKVNSSGTALVYAGYIGGDSGEIGFGIAVDASGNAYVTGWTRSAATTFPVTGGPDLTLNGGQDAFVAKVNASGTALVYAGYIGGSSDEAGQGIAVDAAGSAYVTGYTSSTESTFPKAVGPDLTANGNIDGFVAKVKSDGSGLDYAGFIGGDNEDSGQGIAVDSAGNAYVGGYTLSGESTFPEAIGPDLTHNGGYDAFVARVQADGSALAYAGYIGGSADDLGQGIAVDGAGAAYVAGYTTSTQATFPVNTGPDTTFNGLRDAFVAKVNSGGTSLDYAGYIGGSGTDTGRRIAVDASGSAYVAGDTGSTETTFPVAGGPDLTHNGSFDAFVAKLKADGTGLDFAGYIGGNDDDFGFGVAVDGSHHTYVSGHTFSTQTTFPDAVGPDLTHNGSLDAFVAEIEEVLTPTPTQTAGVPPTFTPTAIPTNTPTAIPTNTPTAIPTNTPTATPTARKPPTHTPKPTKTPKH